MKKFIIFSLILLSSAAFAKDSEIKPCVKFATTWEKGVEEAKLLNVPLVVHSHGFY